MKILNKNLFTKEFIKPILINDKYINSKDFIEYRILFNDKEVSHTISVLKNFHPESIKELDKLFEQTILEITDLDFIKESGLNSNSALLNFSIESLAFKAIHNDKDIVFNTNVVNSNSLYIPNISHKLTNTIKLKISRQEINKDIELINTLISKGHKLRLDANRSLSEDQFIQITNAISNIQNVEYFEEPFNDLSLTEKYKFKFPLALDESFNSLLGGSLDGYNYIVLKPTLYGFNKTIELIIKLNSEGKKVIISSTFENNDQMLDLYKLANFQNKFNIIDHGLDTLGFFK